MGLGAEIGVVALVHRAIAWGSYYIDISYPNAQVIARHVYIHMHIHCLATMLNHNVVWLDVKKVYMQKALIKAFKVNQCRSPSLQVAEE